MELDELKDIWQKNAPTQPKNEAELAMMLKGSSNSVVAKLKKSVWFELSFTIVAGIGLLIYALTLPSGALKWTAVSIIILFVAYSFYYIKKLMLLNKFDSGAVNLKETLVRLVNSLTAYLRFYKRSYAILYPVYFLLGLLFTAIERGTDNFIRAVSSMSSIIWLTTLCICFFVISTWFTSWYLRKLYGNHIDKLKSMLEELNQLEKGD